MYYSQEEPDKEFFEKKLQITQEKIDFIDQIIQISDNLQNSNIKDERQVRQSLQYWIDLKEKKLLEESLNNTQINQNNCLLVLEKMITYMQITFEDKSLEIQKQQFINQKINQLKKVSQNINNKSQYLSYSQKISQLYKYVDQQQKKELVLMISNHFQINFGLFYKMFIEDTNINLDFEIQYTYLQDIVDKFQENQACIDIFLDQIFQNIIRIQFDIILVPQIQDNVFQNLFIFIAITTPFGIKNNVNWVNQLISENILHRILSFEKENIEIKIKETQSLQQIVKTFCILYVNLLQKYQSLDQDKQLIVSDNYFAIFKEFLNLIYNEFQDLFNQQPFQVIQNFFEISKNLKKMLKSLKFQNKQLELLKKFKQEHILSEFQIVNKNIIKKYFLDSKKQEIIFINKIAQIIDQFTYQKLKNLFAENILKQLFDIYKNSDIIPKQKLELKIIIQQIMDQVPSDQNSLYQEIKNQI